MNDAIDWGKEFAIFAAAYHWPPWVVAKLTPAQWRAYRRVALRLVVANAQHPKAVMDAFGETNDNAAFADAVARIKRRTGANSVPLRNVVEEVM